MYELTDSNAEQVRRRGFVHIPGFLPEADIELLRRDFTAALERDPENDYFRRASVEVLHKFLPIFLSVGETLKRVTGIEVDGIYGGGAYFANYAARPNVDAETKTNARGVALGWHQDHESWYMYQDHYNYLNFYIPFEKPDPTRSNLTVVPFDHLQNQAPELCEKMLRRGATRAVQRSDGWIIADDDRGGTLGKLGCNPSEIEETPHLSAGDLLLLRGDILHRTQDTATQRVAASFRMMNGKCNISRKQLAIGGKVKRELMFKRRGEYRALFRLFRMKKRDTVTIHEYVEYMDGLNKLGLVVNDRLLEFKLRLFIEKLNSFFRYNC